MKDRLPRPQVAAVIAGDAAGADHLGVRDDVLSALVNLGYHRPLAERAVASALKRSPGASFEATLKQALREIANA